MYKMVNIIKETLENNDVEVIADSVNALWLNEKNIEKKIGHKHLPVVTNKYDKIYKKSRFELVDKPIKQPNRIFLHNDLALKIIMDCRTDKSCSFKKNLGFKLHDLINTKEQTIINSIKAAFEGENIQTQYSVLGYMIDLYFHVYKLAIEVDELGQLNCLFIRINPDEKDFNIFKEINKIHRHIKKSLIDKI